MPNKYTETEAKNCIEDRMSITETAWQNHRDVWSEIYSLYRFWTSVEPEVALGERSNIFIPLAFSIVETKLPRIVQALLGLDPWFKVFARTSRDTKNAEFMSKVMNFQLNDEINAFNTLTMWWKEALIYGNSYMFVGWDKEEAKVKKRFPRFLANEIVGYDYRSEKETVYDSVALNHIDLWDCFPAPFGTRINGRRFERMPYFLVRSEPTKEYLLQLASKQDQSGQAILNKAKVEEVLQRYPDGTGDVDKERRDRMAYNRMVETNHSDKYSPRYVMWTMYEPDNWVSIIEHVVVRNGENPYGDNKIPIVRAFDTPVPHEHMSIGQIEPIIKLNYYSNDIENLKLDWIMKVLNPGSLINKDAFLDPDRFMNDPDGIHMTKGDPNAAYKSIVRPNVNMNFAQNEQINIERLIDKTLGQSDVSRGQSRSSSDTATEIVSLIEQANFRFDLSIRFLKNESLIPMLDLIANRNQLFWPNEKEITEYTKSGQPQFFGVPISRMLGNYRFKMVTNPAQGNKIAYAQTLIRYLDVINNSQGQNPKLVREVAKFLQIDNADELLDNPCEKAVMMIVQAANEGLLKNSKQASAVLGGVLNILAPPGSETAKKIGAGQPAKDNRDVAKQTGARR